MKDKTERHFFCINDLFFASFKKKKHVYQSITASECAISLCILILFLHSFKIFQKGHDTFKSEIWDVITNWSFRNLYHLPCYRILKTLKNRNRQDFAQKSLTIDSTCCCMYCNKPRYFYAIFLAYSIISWMTEISVGYKKRRLL